MAYRDGWAADDRELDSADDRREVRFVDDQLILDDQMTVDRFAGDDFAGDDNDDRLLAERPPHWD